MTGVYSRPLQHHIQRQFAGILQDGVAVGVAVLQSYFKHLVLSRDEQLLTRRFFDASRMPGLDCPGLWLLISLKLFQTGLDDLHDNSTQRGRGVCGVTFFELADYSNKLFVQ